VRSRQAEVAAKAIQKNVVQIANMMIRMALEGDQKAGEWVLNKALGKERLVRFPMMPIEKPEDVKTAIAGFINAVAQGILTIDEAERLVSMAAKLGGRMLTTGGGDGGGGGLSLALIFARSLRLEGVIDLNSCFLGELPHDVSVFGCVERVAFPGNVE
jgi:hypothetical protein